MTVDDGLRSLFRRHLPQVDWQSIESGGVNRGIPDSNFCHRGCEGWVEFKSTKGYVVDLRPEQIGWIARRVRSGGRVWIAVRRRHDGGPRRGEPVDELYLVHGCYAKKAKLDGLRGLPSRMYGGGPARWDWEHVLATITAI